MLLRKVMYGRDLNSRCAPHKRAARGWCCRPSPRVTPHHPPALARVVAVRGFVHLILEQLRASAPPPPTPDDAGPSQAGGSQASLSQMSALSGGGGVNLLQELAGVLRRRGARGAGGA